MESQKEMMIEVEKSITVAKLIDDLYSVNGKICSTVTGLLNAVREEFGIVVKTRQVAPKKSDLPGVH